MLKKSIVLSIIITLSNFVVSTYAQQDKISIPKGQLLPTPKIVRSEKVVSLKKISTSVIFEENFETEVTLWTKSGSWALGTPISFSQIEDYSNNCMRTSINANYPNSTNDWLITPSISFPSHNYSLSQLKLCFWEWYQIESEYDHGMVKISTDGGNNWTLLSDRSGSSEWRKTTIDITSYSGQLVRIGFQLTSDDSISYEGWSIDDIQIEVHEPEPLNTTMVSLNHQKFPFIYMNVSIDTFGVGFPELGQSNFKVYENNTLQTDYFEVTPPDFSGGSRLADIIFLMDNSGSMAGEINAVSNNVIDFVNNLTSAGVNFALGLCRLGASQNSGAPIIEDNGISISDAEYFKNVVWKRNVTSGGHEPGWDALYESATLFSFRPGAQKIFILITDECVTHPGDTNYGRRTYDEALNILQSNSITAFALIDLNYAKSIEDYGTIAEATNGKYFNIYSNFDDILTYISTQVANNYLVKYKSSNPISDGTLRNVDLVVTYAGNIDTCSSSYIPGSAPIIQRTQATLDLHNNAWIEGTAFNIEADIIDNVIPYVSSARLYYRKTGSTTYNSVNMNLISASTYQGVIPGNAVHTPGLDYYITATDGQNTASDPSVDPNNNPYQIAILPNVAPVITHTPVTALTQGNPIPITTQIFDNTNSVVLAKLFYRKTGQLIYQSVELINSGGNSYQGEISGGYVTNEGLEYYLQATDNFGVSGYYGTPDVPISIMNPMEYVEQKEATINYFLDKNFYINEEHEAQKFINQLKNKINIGTATNKDIEAIRRLNLLEVAAQLSYIGAKDVAYLTGECTSGLLTAMIVEQLFGGLCKALKYLEELNIPLIGGLISDFARYTLDIITIFQRYISDIMTRVCMSAASQGVSYKQFKDLMDTVFGELASEILGKGMEITDFDPIRDFTNDIYLKSYQSLTRNSINEAVKDATYQKFQEGDFESIQSIVINIKQAQIINSNNNTINALEGLLGAAEFEGWVILGSIVVLVAGIILGIASMAPTAGAGGVISVLSTVGLVSVVNSLIQIFSLAQTLSYSLGMGTGVYHLGWSLPQQINNVETIAFEENKNINLTFNDEILASEIFVNEKLNNSYISNNQNRWADSLIVISSKVSQEIIAIKSLISQNKWDEVKVKLNSLALKLNQLNLNQNIVNSLLQVSYLYNNNFKNAGIDSIFYCTAAYSSASDIGIGLSQFAIALALITKPTGSQKDTLIQIITESVLRLQAVGPSYKKTFNQFTSWGFSVPPIVSIIDYQIKGKKTGFDVKCYIKNISDQTVHDIAISLTESSDIGVQIIAKSDTLFSALNTGEEKAIEWQVTCYAQNKLLMLYLDVHPDVSPGDFQGDKKMISQMMGSSPPIPTPLDDKNIYAYPNPFNPAYEDVTIRFMLSKSGDVTIKIYDVSNTLVTTLISDVPMEDSKELAVKWDGKNDNGEIVANGTYFYRITTSSDEEATGKVAVLR